MGMSMSVYGIRPPDARWKKMKTIWDSCVDAGVAVPDAVDTFFGGEEPDPSGVLIDLEDCGRRHDCVKAYNAEMRDGFEVDLDKIPDGIKVVRFVCSY